MKDCFLLMILVTKNLQSKFWIVIIASVIFYTSIILYSDISKVTLELNQIKFEYYLIIFPLVTTSYVVQSMRFNLILHKIGIKLRFKDSFLIYTAGASMSVTPAGLGAVIKSYILKKKIGKSFSSTIPVIIFEKWIDMVGIVIVIGVLLFWIDFVESLIVFTIGLIFLSFIFVILKKKVALNFIKNTTNKIRFMKKFIVNFEDAQGTVSKLFSTRIILETLPYTLLHKAISIMTVFLIFESFQIDFDVLLSGQIYYTSTMIGALTFIPGGIIVVESGLLGLILKSGIALSTASVLVLMIRFVTMWYYLIIGFFVLKIMLKKDELKSDKL